MEQKIPHLHNTEREGEDTSVGEREFNREEDWGIG